MSSNLEQDSKEIKNIEIAIELDRGVSITEVAKKFKVKKTYVNSIANKSLNAEKKLTRIAKKRYTDPEKLVLLERIENGELLREIAIEEGISENTLRGWCRLFGIIVPRRIEKISENERNEIRELLENNDWEEISKIYNITKDAIKELKDPPHSRLDVNTLSYLFELLRERPNVSVKSICKIMNEAGLNVKAFEVNSYKKRLSSLKII